MATKLEQRIAGERAVLLALFDHLISKGYLVRIYDDEGETLKPFGQAEREDYAGWIHAMDELEVSVVDDKGRTKGWFLCIFGNDPDEVLSNHTDNELCNEAATAAYAALKVKHG